MWYSFALTKVRRVSSATNQWTRTSITAMAVGTVEVLIAGMQLLGDALRTSFNHTVAPRYSFNRRYLLSPVLSTDRPDTLGWILSLTSTARSRIWMCPLLLLSLAIRPWSLQPAQIRDLWPREPKRTTSTGIHRSTSFLSSLRPQVGLAHMPRNLSATSCETPTTRHWTSGTPGPPSKVSSGCHLQTTTHSRRCVTHYCHTQYSFYAPRFWMQVPP